MLNMCTHKNFENKYIFAAAFDKWTFKNVLAKVHRGGHQDVFFDIAVLSLWSNFFKIICAGVQFLVNLHITLSCFWPVMQNSYIFSHHFAEQLLLFVNHLSKAAFVFWKAGESFRETFRIIRQIPSSIFYETSTGCPIIWRKLKCRFLFDTLLPWEKMNW